MNDRRLLARTLRGLERDGDAGEVSLEAWRCPLATRHSTTKPMQVLREQRSVWEQRKPRS